MRKKMKVASLLFVLTGLLTLGGTLSACQKPTAGLMLFVQTNAETSTSEAPAMYVKNATYLAEFPFAN